MPILSLCRVHVVAALIVGALAAWGWKARWRL
jgi:predicted histidine transporter YuiF (NhaC family)